MKDFFKDIRFFVRDIPDVFKALLVGILVILACFLFRNLVKMFYNKDKVKFAFLPILGLAILVALTVFICVA